MSFLDKLKQRVKDIEEATIADEQLANSRLDICNSCEFLFQPTKNCKKCGCFVVAKTKLKQQKCPINKW